MNLSLRVGATRGRGFSSFLPRELAGENSGVGWKKHHELPEGDRGNP